MAQTLDQINALRSFKGEEPLTELPAENLENKEPSAETAKIEASSDNPITEEKKEEKKQSTPEQGGEKPTVIVSDNEGKVKEEKIEKKEPTAVVEPIELDDTAILEA